MESVSYNPLGLLKARPAGLQSQIDVLGLNFRTPGLRSSMWDLDHLFLIENSAVVIIFLFMSDIYRPRVCVY